NLKTGVIVSIFIFFFFSYGYFYEAVKSVELLSFISRHRYLMPLWLSLFGVGSYLLIKIKNLNKATEFFSVFAFVLVLAPLINLGIYETQRPSIINEKLFTDKDAAMLSGQLKNKNQLPDVYYLMPDGFGNIEALKEAFGYDGSEFIRSLKDKGFFVATNSRTNYPTTGRSLSSALNMDYVDSLSARIGVDVDNRGDVQKKMINDNKVMHLLKSQGYQFITFSSGWSLTNYNKNADIQFNGGRFDEFPMLLAQTTLLKPFFSGGKSFFAIDADAEMRKRVSYAFDKLGNEIPRIEGPKFIFAHMPVPHPPFLFDADGHEISKDGGDFNSRDIANFDDVGYAQAYLGQLEFISKKLDETVENILLNSKTPPIIIIQSDHGPFIPEPKNPDYDYPTESTSDERLRASLKNFAAYYLPKKNKAVLPNDMSPVNTFRLIFDQYFGTSYGLLKNKSYYHHPNRSGVEIPTARLK
ncbi:MAG: sulfatase-like hydrolase/transferase, partial [bacterium]|nr:sulfatase-like hydrolase/transferase [bacterium]